MLESECRLRELRRRLVGASAAAMIDVDARTFDSFAVAAFPAPDVDEALEVAATISDGGAFYAAAERTLSAASTDRRTGRSILIETLLRNDVELLAGELAVGEIVVANLRGAGPYVVMIRQLVAAARDERTVGLAEEKLFREWLTSRRAESQIHWNWGAVDDEEG